jgi:hypothetical protein
VDAHADAKPEGAEAGARGPFPSVDPARPGRSDPEAGHEARRARRSTRAFPSRDGQSSRRSRRASGRVSHPGRQRPRTLTIHGNLSYLKVLVTIFLKRYTRARGAHSRCWSENGPSGNALPVRRADGREEHGGARSLLALASTGRNGRSSERCA